VNSSESTRHETNVEMERLSSEVDQKTTELHAATQKIDEYATQIEQLSNALEIQREQNAAQKKLIQNANRDFRSLRENSVSKQDFRDAIQKLEDEKSKLIDEVRIARTQFASVSSQNAATQAVLEQQEAALSKAQAELRNLSIQNRRLRRQGQRISTSTPETTAEVVETEKKCQNCIALNEQISLLQAAIAKNANEETSSQDNMAVLVERLAEFYARLTEIVKASDNEALLREAAEVRTVMDGNSNLADRSRAVFGLGISVIDSFIFSLRSKAPVEAETKLLRSSILHLERKIATLQGENALKSNEISQLQSDLKASLKNKEKYESDVQSMSHSVAAFRTSLQSTQRRLVESERTRKQVEGNVSQQTYSRKEVMDEDISDGNEVKQSKIFGQSRVAALSDSLALLDLLCQ
jgi:chromosome segregation ATPase